MPATKANPDRYIFPPRATAAIPREDTDTYKTLGWIAQYKYNDTRLLLKILPATTNDPDGDDGRKFELWNRHGERIRYHVTPELRDELHGLCNALGLSRDNWHLLDGGLLDAKHAAIKDTIVIWDILVREGEHLLGTTYAQRQDWLLSQLLQNQGKNNPNDLEPWYYAPTHGKHQPLNLGYRITDHIFTPASYHHGWDDMWETVNTANAPYDNPVLEGLFFKDVDVPLEMGLREKNNSSWNARCRVTTGRHRF